MSRNKVNVETARYEDAPWAPRLPGAKWAYRVTNSNGNSVACSTKKPRDAIGSDIQKLAKALGGLRYEIRGGWPARKEAAHVA